MPALQSAKILEVFRSIQGEGLYLGLPQVFVRFFECNMHCVWCDSPASIGDTSRNYKDIAIEALAAQIVTLYDACHSVSITGGEPLLQVEALKVLLPILREREMTIYLETNGVLPKELAMVIHDVDIVAMDFKLPSSTKEKPFWREHEEFLHIAQARDVFIKTVITKDTTDDDVYQAVDLVRKIDPDLCFILQPNYFDMKESNDCIVKCVELQKYCMKILKDVRVIPQVHKFMKLR